MGTALFTNFTSEEFTGYWDGKAKTFKAGESKYLPTYLAEHFAKHLVNKELLRTDKKGNLIYPNGEKMTSPKFPDQVPMFNDLFKKACILSEEEDDTMSEAESIDDIIKLKNNPEANKKSQIIIPIDDEEEEFEAKPKK